MASDGYHRGYVSFAHFLLFLLSAFNLSLQMVWLIMRMMLVLIPEMMLSCQMTYRFEESFEV